MSAQIDGSYMLRKAEQISIASSPDESGQGSLFPLIPGQGEAFRRIRNYLAGRVIGATRDKTLLAEVVKCIFCKAYLSQRGVDTKPLANDALERKYRATLQTLHKLLPNVVQEDETINLDAEALAIVDSELDLIDFADPDRDPLGDAYETFAGSTLRQQEGQFFTPLKAVDWLVQALEPTASETVIDPACGAGGFLSSVARRKIKEGASPRTVAKTLFGVEKDFSLARLAASHISLVTLQTSQIVCGDSLALVSHEGQPMEDSLRQFDIVLSNPPFGTKIVSTSDTVRRRFELGYKWIPSALHKRFEKTKTLQSNVPPQVLFVERIVSLLKPGGRMGVVLRRAY
jgi:type I restriction enzyme M protein